MYNNDYGLLKIYYKIIKKVKTNNNSVSMCVD